MANFIIIMAGGIGSRFWPQSTAEKPKQFLDILQSGKTMIQQTVERVSAFCPVENIFVVTSKNYIPLVLQQIEGIGAHQVLGEPCMRNTAPCIAYAVWKIRLLDPQATILVLPSDSFIPDTHNFVTDMEFGLDYVSRVPAIMTLGIRPSSPETGYGYIECQKDVSLETNRVHLVSSFREKPQFEKALEYLNAGNFFWNAGIFMASAKTFETAFREYLPHMAAQFDCGNEVYHTEKEQDFIDQLYVDCQNISMDYGIMEKASNIVVQEASFSWSDLGAWNALHELQAKDENGNTSFNTANNNRKVIYEDVNNCLLSVPENTEVVVQGVSDLIIVQAENRLLICKKDNEQEIKQFLSKLKSI